MERTLEDLLVEDALLELSGCSKNRNRDSDRGRERDRDGSLSAELNAAGMPIESRLMLDDDLTAALYAENTMVKQEQSNPTLAIPVK